MSGNGLNLSTQIYAKYAVDKGYEVEVKEPESDWWQEIRVLLKYKEVTRPILLQWADILAKMSRGNHRVPASLIRRRMAKWKYDLSVDDILKYTPPTESKTGVNDSKIDNEKDAFGP